METRVFQVIDQGRKRAILSGLRVEGEADLMQDLLCQFQILMVWSSEHETIQGCSLWKKVVLM